MRPCTAIVKKNWHAEYFVRHLLINRGESAGLSHFLVSIFLGQVDNK